MSSEAVRRWVDAVRRSDHPLRPNEESTTAVDSFVSRTKTANVREPSLRCLSPLRNDKEVTMLTENCATLRSCMEYVSL